MMGGRSRRKNMLGRNISSSFYKHTKKENVDSNYRNTQKGHILIDQIS